jgi:cobalt-zinc-cadmium efflux system outer membrane protein
MPPYYTWGGRWLAYCAVSLVLLAGSLAGSVAFADNPTDPALSFSTRGITLTDAFKQAEQNNMQLQAAQKNINLAEFDVRITRQYANPQFVGNFSSGKIVSVLSNPQQVSLSQDIETAGKHRLKVDIAQSQLALTRFQVDQIRWDIRGQVRQAYASLVAAQQSLDNLEIQSALFDRLVEISTKRFQAGAAPRSEVLQAQLARNQLESQKNQVFARSEQASYTMNSLLGNTTPPYFEPMEKGVLKIRIQKTDLAPDLNFSLPSPDMLYAKALMARPDLRATNQQKEIALRQLKLTRRQRIPDLSLLGGWLFAPAPQPDGSYRWYHGAFVQTTFDLPVYHNQRWEIKRAETVIQQAELQLRDMQRQAQLEINRSYSQVQATRRNIELYETNLIPAARASLQLAQRSYEVGKTPLANVVLAQQATQQVLSNYLDAVVDHQNAWGDLERTVGVPIEQW